MVLVTSCTSAIWEIPGVTPASVSDSTKLYSVVASLVLCSLGSWLWKRCVRTSCFVGKGVGVCSVR
jgi:hypothetical protein